MSLSIAGGYSPGTATVRVGQQIFWHSTDPTEPHAATNHGAGAFNTGLIPAGGTSGPIKINGYVFLSRSSRPLSLGPGFNI
jgi:hypothetical protein